MQQKTNVFTKALNANQPLSDRIRHSEEFLKEISAKAGEQLGNSWEHVSVFVAGSLGRFETGRRSDLDIFLLANDEALRLRHETKVSHLEEIQLLAKLIQINSALALPEFSGDGRYLKIHSVKDLVDSTGDANDDSENYFTTRLLLLLESKAVWNTELRKSAIERVLENYFKDGKGKDDFRPLFLLNDLLRYWRTICLNYERNRIAPTAKWWKKNLNLKFARKLTVFSSVLSIVTKAVETKEDILMLAEQVPLQRLALALDALGDEQHLAAFCVILDDYESFLAAKSHGEVEELTDTRKTDFDLKAERFGHFFYDVLMSPKIDASLRRYLLI
jgi:predicted nucleotidyltransferase